MIMCIIEFMNRFVVSVSEDGRFAVMRVHVWSSMLGRIFLTLQQLSNVFGDGIEEGFFL